MERMEFLFQSSDAEPYRITIEKKGNSLNAYCTCAAGSNGKPCRHRLQILSDNPDSLIDCELDQVRLAVDWLAGTEVESAMQELARAEDSYELAKSRLSNAKKRFAKALLK